MSEKINERANEYYNQCSNAYAEYKPDHNVPDNTMPLPDPMDDNYSVPAELLLIGLIIDRHSMTY